MAWGSLLDLQGAQSQKEGQEDQGTLKPLGEGPRSSFTSTWSSWPSFWLWVTWKSSKLYPKPANYPYEFTAG